MTDADLRTLRHEISALQPGGAARRFLFCPAGPDGFPILKVGRRIPPADIAALLRWARVKRLVQGEVFIDAGGGICFASPRADGAFLDGVADFFSEEIPALARDRLSAPL